MQIQFKTSITMKKSLFLIGICLLFAVSCNQPKKEKQQKEEAVVGETVQQDQGFNLFTMEAFVDLINQNDEAAAAKCGMSFLYEGELDDDMEDYEGVEGEEVYEGDAGMSVVAFGKDIELGEPSELGYALKRTSDHAYYYEIVTATSINQDLYFANQKDANAFFEKLKQCETVEGERKFSVTLNQNNLGNEYLLLEAVDDSGDTFSVDAPVLRDDLYVISIYKYV